jgi:hypothetical protein
LENIKQVKAIYCLLPSIGRGGFIFSQGSKDSLVRPADKSRDEMALSMEHWWNNTARGTPKYVSGGKTFSRAILFITVVTKNAVCITYKD